MLRHGGKIYQHSHKQDIIPDLKVLNHKNDEDNHVKSYKGVHELTGFCKR
jgi:hypothetical protein